MTNIKPGHIPSLRSIRYQTNQVERLHRANSKKRILRGYWYSETLFNSTLILTNRRERKSLPWQIKTCRSPTGTTRVTSSNPRPTTRSCARAFALDLSAATSTVGQLTRVTLKSSSSSVKSNVSFVGYS